MEHLFAHGEPAGGAPLEDLVPATAVGLILVGLVVALSYAHRSGRTRALHALGGFGERVSGLPGWAAVPIGITTGSLLVAVFGFYWDVATHIDAGRDAGPFANPSHYFIIFGLAGIALAGIVAIVLGCRHSQTSIRIRDGWHAPLGGVMLLVCGGIAVMGFPLDDVWHRLFGQDVTLWSPTHMQMVGGAALATFGLWMLWTEGSRAPLDAPKVARLARLIVPAIGGAVLIGLSAFQAEFDYSVPQFRLLYHPVLLMLSAGVALVAVRLWLGRGAALKSVGFFIFVRALLTLIVGAVFGHTALHFPLYIVVALAVELVAARMGTERQLTFGVVAGAAIGTFGLAAEWSWSNIWMTMSWDSALIPEALLFGPLAGVAGGALGALIGRALLPSETRRQRPGRWFVPATIAGVLFCLAYPFPTDAALDGQATITMETVQGEGGEWANITVALDDPALVDEAEWFNITSWQGGGSVVQELEETGPGVWTVPEPVPVHGEWKTLIRMQGGRSIMALPLYLPRDPAIPAEGVPVQVSSKRAFGSDKEFILREARDVSPALTIGASTVIFLIGAAWFITLGWGFRRLEMGPARRSSELSWRARRDLRPTSPPTPKRR